MSLATQIIDQQVAGVVDRYPDVFVNELWLGTDLQKKRSAAFPENAVTRMIDALGALFDPARAITLNTRLEQRVEEIRFFVEKGAIPRVTAVAANNGIKWTAEAQQRIDAAAVGFNGQVGWRYIGAEDLLALLQARRPISTELKLTGQATVETFDFRRVLIGRMSVVELARLANDHDNQLFERNIRRYLGLARNRVNEAVADTLRDLAQRSNFYLYNNGITITCSQFRHNALQRGDWTLHVNDLQVVNGGQTVRTVQRVHEEIGSEIEPAEVLVRIYELRQDDNDTVVRHLPSGGPRRYPPVGRRRREPLNNSDSKRLSLWESASFDFASLRSGRTGTIVQSFRRPAHGQGLRPAVTGPRPRPPREAPTSFPGVDVSVRLRGAPVRRGGQAACRWRGQGRRRGT